MLGTSPVSNDVRRTLVYHHALVKSLKQKFQCAAKEKTRNLIARIVSGKILKKYRFQKIIHDTLGVSAKRFCKNVNTNGDEIACFARKKYISTHLKLQDQVVAFYTRDDVSRSTAGKKQTVTKGKVKKQKRFMTDTMKNLHRKFLLENVSSKLSYTLFCRMRPYWVVHPTIADRDTCLCKVHENLEFIVEKLHDLKLLEKTELESLAEETCCNPTFKPCMYAECKNCKLQDLKIQSGYDGQTQVSCVQWTTETVLREKKSGDSKEKLPVNITVKRENGEFFGGPD